MLLGHNIAPQHLQRICHSPGPLQEEIFLTWLLQAVKALKSFPMPGWTITPFRRNDECMM